MRPQRLDAERFANVCARLGSPHDGEKLAAIAAADRMLAIAGASWADLGRALLEVVAQRDLDDGGEALGHHYREARELLLDGAAVLTDWEKSFLVGLQSFGVLSSKQTARLAALRRKVETAALWSTA